MPPRKEAVAAPFDVHSACSILEAMLRAQLDGHGRLRACIKRKREAIRTADIDGVTTICGEENSLIQRLGELEKRRLELIGRITQHFRPSAARPMSLAEIAESAGPSLATRLTAFASQLKDLIGEVRRESSVVRSAAEALTRHMGGIVQTVNAALSRARVYGQRGRIIAGTQLYSSVDLRS
jgi:FlgN protein